MFSKKKKGNGSGSVGWDESAVEEMFQVLVDDPDDAPNSIVSIEGTQGCIFLFLLTVMLLDGDAGDDIYIIFIYMYVLGVLVC